MVAVAQKQQTELLMFSSQKPHTPVNNIRVYSERNAMKICMHFGWNMTTFQCILILLLFLNCKPQSLHTDLVRKGKKPWAKCMGITFPIESNCIVLPQLYRTCTHPLKIVNVQNTEVVLEGRWFTDATHTQEKIIFFPFHCYVWKGPGENMGRIKKEMTCNNFIQNAIVACAFLTCLQPWKSRAGSQSIQVAHITYMVFF